MGKLKETVKPILNRKTLKEEITRQREDKGLKPRKRFVKIGMSILLLVMILFLLFSFFEYKAHKNILDTRDTRLDSQELIRFSVLDSLNAYLSIASESDYNSVKQTFTGTDDFKRQLFGAKYDPEKFVGAEGIVNIDAQYTLEDDIGRVRVLVKYLVTSKGSTYTLTLMATVVEGKIADVLIL